MANHQGVSSMFAVAAALLLVAVATFPAGVHAIGVCNGVLGNDLLSPADVVKLYRAKGISAMRIYSPESNVLRALSGTGIGLLMDVANENISAFASAPSAAAAWVKANVKPYPGVSFRYIAVGNEVTDVDAQKDILPAMMNLDGALAAAGFSAIKVSTSLRFDVVTDTFPPSSGVFADGDFMVPIAEYLESTGAPLLVNVYPYFAYVGDTTDIHLDYATFQPGTTVTDDGNGLTYTSLFDAMVDSIYAALEDAGTPGVKVVVSETGWPSSGSFAATVQNARTYNQNLINHVGKGTPKRTGPLETYMFAMFNENLKKGDETERHFGLFNPDKSPAYTLSF
uniref:Uncharacterized protein n=1 Tax=Avena sativa TaxID=4498 RepID=A0ACD5X955_AVESA